MPEPADLPDPFVALEAAIAELEAQNRRLRQLVEELVREAREAIEDDEEEQPREARRLWWCRRLS
jgi:hypothetical protein